MKHNYILFSVLCTLYIFLPSPVSANACVRVDTKEETSISLRCGFEILTMGTPEKVSPGQSLCKGNITYTLFGAIKLPCMYRAVSTNEQNSSCESDIMYDSGTINYRDKRIMGGAGIRCDTN